MPSSSFQPSFILHPPSSLLSLQPLWSLAELLCYPLIHALAFSFAFPSSCRAHTQQNQLVDSAITSLSLFNIFLRALLWASAFSWVLFLLLGHFVWMPITGLLPEVINKSIKPNQACLWWSSASLTVSCSPQTHTTKMPLGRLDLFPSQWFGTRIKCTR